MKERECLQIALESLRPRIQKRIGHLEKSKNQKEILKEIMEDILLSNNYKATTGSREVSVEVQYSITNCDALSPHMSWSMWDRGRCERMLRSCQMAIV